MTRNAAAMRFALEVDVDAEAGEPRNGVRGVDLPLDLELLLLPGREDAVEQLLGDVGRQDRRAVEARKLATHPYRRRRADGEVEV